MCRIQLNEEHLTMDTNPIAHNAASNFPGRPKMASGALHAARTGLAAAALFVSVGVVAAQERYPVGATQYYGLYDSGQQRPSLSRSDRIHFDHSGTRGRDGLGESPFHPEGPGNPSD